MKINSDRLWNRLHELGKIGVDEYGGITRWPFTEVDMEAKNWLIKEMKNAGLMVKEDYVGNIIGIYNPMGSTQAPVLSGSHYDTVRNGGIFDGCLGILSALETAEVFKENHVKLKRPFYVIAYKDEEGNRFRHGMIGSKAITGKLVEEDLRVIDEDEISISQAMKVYGYEPERAFECKIDPIHASVELHIEQGKVLEKNDCNVGIVEGIPYHKTYEITIRGCSGHAGATPMKERIDPVLAMTKWIQKITELTSNYSNTVATVGIIKTFPGSINVICDYVTFTLDIRSLKLEILERCFNDMEEIENELKSKGFTIEHVLKHYLVGIDCDEEHKNLLDKIMTEKNISHMRLVSGAGHDSQNFKDVCPCSMIFVRSKDGLSHRKEEFSSKDDCAYGAEVLMTMIHALCSE